MPPHMKQLVEFLLYTQECKKEQTTPNARTIAYADDQFINRKLILVQFKEIGLQECLVDFANGQEVVDYFTRILLQLAEERKQVVQPVSLLLLDINMPVLNGHETLKKVKQLFKDFNESSGLNSPLVLRPMICYLSSTENDVMTQFLDEDEQAEIYLEKPLPKSVLAALIKLSR